MTSKLYKAIAKSVSGRFLTYIVQFIALAIYARLFTPQEFGLIASIQVFVTFFKMLSSVGIGPAIINEDDFSNSKRDGVFTVTIILGVVIALGFYFFSYFLNYFYGEYEYQNIAAFVSLSILFSTFNIVPNTALVKDSNFFELAFIDVIGELLCFLIVYSLYINGFGLLSLASRPAIQSAFRFFLCWLRSSNTSIGRARAGTELYHIKAIMKFSMYQFGFNFINYFSRNLDNILIAKYFGMNAVGVYDKSYQLMRYPLLMTTSAMAPAIQPVLTKVRADKDLIIREHNTLTARLLALSIPISIFMFLYSRDILLVLFGEQWLVANDLIKILSFMIPIQAVLSTSGSFFQVINCPRLLFISGVIAAVVTVGAILFGLFMNSVNYIASSLVVAFFINFIQIYHVLFKYGFKSSIKCFYIRMIKVLLCMALPNTMFILFNLYVISDYEYSPIINIIIGIVLGLVILSLFINPIKKCLISSK